MILVGCFLTLLILVGIILLFSYSKFHELLSDLKREVDTQNAHNRKSIEDLTKQMDQYDLMLKQLEAKVSGGTNDKNTFKDSQERNPRETSPKRVARSIRSLDALNKVNTHLIRWLFNETFINEGNETTTTTPMTGTTRRQQAKAFMNNNQKRVLNSMMLSKARRNEIYQKVIDEFLKSNYDVAMTLSSSTSSANGSNDEYLAVDDIGAELEAYFEGFEQSIKNDILYEIEKSVVKPLMETLSKCKCSQNTTITQPQAA